MTRTGTRDNHCMTLQLFSVLVAVICQGALACRKKLEIPSWTQGQEHSHNIIHCATGSGNGQGLIVNNPLSQQLQWLWLTPTQRVELVRWGTTDYWLIGSQVSTVTDQVSMVVGTQCPEEECYMAVLCAEQDGVCDSVSVEFVDGNFTTVQCAFGQPVSCDSLPSKYTCEFQEADQCSNCCLGDAVLNGIGCWSVELSDSARQLCSTLVPISNSTPSTSPVPYTQPSWDPIYDDPTPFQPSPDFSPWATQSATPASYVPPASVPSSGNGMFSPGPTLYGVIGGAGLVVVVIAMILVRFRRQANLARQERAIPLLSQQSLLAQHPTAYPALAV